MNQANAASISVPHSIAQPSSTISESCLPAFAACNAASHYAGLMGWANSLAMVATPAVAKFLGEPLGTVWVASQARPMAAAANRTMSNMLRVVIMQ